MAFIFLAELCFGKGISTLFDLIGALSYSACVYICPNNEVCSWSHCFYVTPTDRVS
jgi:hypothetical protein